MPRQHVEIPGSYRPSKSDARRLRDSDPDLPVEVTVDLRKPEMPGVNDLPTRSITPDELAATYGASQADADKTAQVLGRYGLKVEEVSLPTWSMRMSGPVSAVEAAFQTRLGVYHSREQGDFRGREGILHVPIELAGVVTGVFGLDERRVAAARQA